MRPTKAKQKINNILWNQFINKQDINKDLPFLKRRIKTIQPELEYMYKKYKNEQDLQDLRTGAETYGYNPDEIKSNLVYISDRWQCAFRVRWLLDLIKDPNEPK